MNACLVSAVCLALAVSAGAASPLPAPLPAPPAPVDSARPDQVPVGPAPGTVLWISAVPQGDGGGISSPALGIDGTVVVRLDGVLFALDGATGRPRWSFVNPQSSLPGLAALDSPPAIGYDGTVYVGSKDPRLHALQGVTGVVRWTFAAPGAPVSSPAMARDGRTLYVGCGTGETGSVCAVDAETGIRRWESRIGADGGHAPTLGIDGTVYMAAQVLGEGGSSAALYALEGSTGAVRWRFVRPVAGGRFNQPALGADGTVYVGVTDGGGGLYAVNGDTGSPRWAWTSPIPMRCPAIGPDGTVFVGDRDCRLRAFDGATGALRWLDTTPSEWGCFDCGFDDTPALTSGGTLYFAPDAFSLWSYDRATGAAQWAVQSRQGVGFSPVVGPDGIVYLVVGLPGGVGSQVWAVEGTDGPADSPWPRSRADARNTGRPRTAPPRVPEILAQSRDQTVAVGSTAVVAVDTAGVPPVEFQWWANGELLPGATNAALILTHVQRSHDAGYWVTARNAFGAATSTVARVVVGYSLSLTTRGIGTLTASPASSVYLVGQSVELTATPGQGATFVGWRGDLSGTENPVRIAMDRSQTVVAEFSVGIGGKLWEFQTGGAVRSSPAIGDDGTVYVGSMDGAVYALDGTTGLARWQFRTTGRVADSPVLGADGRLFVTCQGRDPYSDAKNFKLYALDGATGSPRWERALEPLDLGLRVGQPCLGPDSTLYLPIQVGVCAVEGSSGTVRWSTNLISPGPGLGATPPVMGPDGRIYGYADWISNWQVFVWAAWSLDGATGSRWPEFQPSPGRWTGSPAVGEDGTLYACTASGVLALDAHTGATQWARDLGACAPVALGSEGTVYVGSTSGKVHALNGSTGTPRWSIATGGSVETCPAITADGTVYVGSTDRKLYALDGATGAERWEFLTGGPVRSSPAIAADGTVYVGSEDTRVYALRGIAVLARSPWPKYRADAGNTGSRIPPLTGPPRIVRQPGDVRVSAGSGFLLSIQATGTSPLTYRWYRNDQPVTTTDGAGFVVPRATLGDAGSFVVVVTNARGSVTSAVARVVVGYVLTVTHLGSGSIELDPLLAVYEPGQEVELRAIPDAGGMFLGWEGDVSGSASPTRLLMNAPKFVQARFSAPEGERLWEVRQSTNAPSGGGVPAIGPDGTLYVVAGQAGGGTRLVALDGTTGTTRWTAAMLGIRGSPAISENGTVYLGGDRLSALEAGTGALRWDFALEGAWASDPGIAADGTVYSGFSPVYPETRGGMYAMASADGTRRWVVALTGSNLRVGAPALGPDGVVYFGTSHWAGTDFFARVLAVDGASGATLWEFASTDLQGDPILGGDGALYAGGRRLFALDCVTGVKRWEWSDGDFSFQRMIAGPDGTVYVVGVNGSMGANHERLYALDGSSGAKRWQADDLSGGLLSTPALAADGTLHLGTQDAFNSGGQWYAGGGGRIHAVNGSTGLRRWSYGDGILTTAFSAPTIGPGGVVYFETEVWTYERGIVDYLKDTSVLAIQGTVGLSDGPWPKYRSDARNSGRVGSGSTGRPVLRVRRGSEALVLSWDGNGFRLQTATNLAPTAAWQDLLETPSSSATFPIESNGPRFYRLRSGAGGER